MINIMKFDMLQFILNIYAADILIFSKLELKRKKSEL